MTTPTVSAPEEAEDRRRPTGPRWSVAALTLAVFAFYCLYAVSRQATLLTAGYDLGIFDQAVRQYAHLHAPIVTLKGPGYDIFADHFHPIIAAVAPLYLIWDSPYVLLVVQAALVAASVPVVHAFTRRRTSAPVALAVSFGYGFGWAIQTLVDFDFHEIAFALPLLAGAIDALDRRSDRTLFVCAALLLLVREDMGVVVAILAMLRLTRTPRRTGWVLLVSGAATYVLATRLIIPAFAPGGHFTYWTFDALGHDLPAALRTILTRPWHAAHVFVSPWPKIRTLAFLFVPVALLSLRSRYFWLAVPLLAERFWNSRPNLWLTQFHYNALPWLVLVLAMVDAAERLAVWRHRPTRLALAGWVACVPIVLAVWPYVTPGLAKRMVTGAAFDLSGDRAAMRAAVRLIPRDVCVWASDHAVPQLTSRDRVTVPGLGGPGPDFVVVDRSERSVSFHRATPQQVVAEMTGRGYTVVFQRRSAILLRSPGYAGPSRRCGPTAARSGSGRGSGRGSDSSHRRSGMSSRTSTMPTP